MRSEWRTVKLGSVLGGKGYIRGPFGSALRRGELKQQGIPVYEQKHAIDNVRSFRYFIDQVKFKELSRSAVQPDDLIISCSGTLGEVSIIREGDPIGIISQALLLLRPDVSRILPDYLYYFLSSSRGYDSITGVSSGSVQVNIARRSIIEDIEFPLPPLPEQRTIAHILSTLDDKIELNRQMNHTLEAIARALFKSWFVDFDPVHAKAAGEQPVGMDAETAALFPDAFVDSDLGPIPEGWEVSDVGAEFDITMGQSPPGDTYNEEGQGMPFYQGRRDFGFRYPSLRVYCNAPTRRAKRGDTLVSVRAPVGDINMALQDCCIGRGVAAVRHVTGSRSYTYYAMTSLCPLFDRFEAEGTVFGSLGKRDFHQLPFLSPSESIQQAFEQLVDPFDGMIENNELQSITLSELRDTLLPKLISGELRVPVV